MESFPPADEAQTPTIAEDPALGLSQRAKLEILGAVLLGMFLAALDQTIVGPVLPKIIGELNGSDYYTWAVTIYLLTSTVTVPIYGKLSDLYGRKPIFMAGIGLFLVGSALSGLSQEMWQLVLFRGVQGLGAGALFPIALAVIGDLFTPAERGKYQGLFGLVFGVAFILGPLIGGFLTDTFSWHYIFFVNLPIGADRAARDLAAAPEHPARRARRQDRLGGRRHPHARLGAAAHRLHGRRDGRLRRSLLLGVGRRGPVLPRDLRARRAAQPGAGDPAPPVPQPDVLVVDGLDLLRDLRLRGRDHLPAVLLPDRAGRHDHRVRAIASCRSCSA